MKKEEFINTFKHSGNNNSAVFIENYYNKNNTKKYVMIIFLFILVVLLMGVSISLGTMDIDLKFIFKSIFTDTTNFTKDQKTLEYVIKHIRMPRVITAAITGFALGISGVVMQNLLKNPLAGPYTLGVSSGASFGAAIAIVLGTRIWGSQFIIKSQVFTSLFAFIFGGIAMMLVFLISKIKDNSITVLLLAGVAVSSLFSAGLSALKYISNAEALRDLMLWLMGGFWGAKWKNIYILFPVVLLSSIVLYTKSQDFNALFLGDDLAKTMGVDVKKTHKVGLLLTTLMASTAIAFSGIIGFIGLVAPHISRSIFGTDNKILIPASALMGSFILLLADTIARNAFSPIEIPVGIITSLIGAPFFIYILISRKSGDWQ